ncbi:hypothetical protein M9H77_14155 [Catharanthus roseus]|uniref:Uncharacterized protein n=1 Tax=Catharanthus roseus TaxID=4058 RepID=A0ACC0BMD1_CATRO|nr:hypothetical protein M9H77_14155 [Catharanthus roseus]
MVPCSYSLTLVICICICCCCLLSSVSLAYKNYTVGDSFGWYDNLEKPPGFDYQKWADAHGNSFTLGDFLIFNTDNNHSVVQTYNFTTYKSCNYDDALENDTIQWSSADPSSTSPRPVTVPVPLLKLGITYFFSGDYDGEQCLNGQNFKINVTYGQGLPPSLKSPSSSSSSSSADAPISPAANPDFDPEDSAPETLVPSNFDHPQNVSDDSTTNTDQPSKAATIPLPAAFLNFNFFGLRLNGFMIFLILIRLYGFFWIVS